MKNVKLLLFALLATMLAASLGFANDRKFHAKLSGGEEVPSVETKAKGEAKFKLSKDGTEMRYELRVKNIKNATAAHIHRGKKGSSGPPLANLYTGPKKEGEFNGTLAEGTLTENDLTGELTGKSFNELVQYIQSGETYVNVHTDANPDGEIRGQIK